MSADMRERACESTGESVFERRVRERRARKRASEWEGGKAGVRENARVWVLRVHVLSWGGLRLNGDGGGGREGKGVCGRENARE